MPTMDEIRQGGTPFDPFLYANVGEDRNGNIVSVLSTLARLGLDPWGVAADLSALTRDEARARLGGLLARFGDVPALKQDFAAIARQLIDLLPQASSRRANREAGDPAPAGGIGLGAILAILMVTLLLILSLLPGVDGAGG